MNSQWKRLVRPLVIAGAVVSMAAAMLPAGAQEKTKETGAAACFARLKKLAGEWVQKDTKTGKDFLILKYRVISGGSAVEESIMPGSPGEMTSIYYLDNDSLVMTHYCSIGNQPHLKATSASTPSRIEFECAGGGGNMKSENDMHIHSAIFTIPADDRFTAVWSANKDGKSAGGNEKFEVHRKAK